jgi:hypothetical protein
MNLDAALHTWANAATVLVIAGAIVYATLIPYMTRDR